MAKAKIKKTIGRASEHGPNRLIQVAKLSYGINGHLRAKEKETGEPPAETPEASQEQINMACAALLLEVAEADYADDPEETRAIISALEAHLCLKHSEVQTLL